MNKRNYQRELDKLIDGFIKEDVRPSLLLHVCCAPCSSYCLEYLSKYFDISILFYNPNIDDKDEYELRKQEEIRLIGEMKLDNPVSFLDIDHETDKFLSAVKGLETEKEGGKRCAVCFGLRLDKTAEVAHLNGFDYFTTSLTISPLKNASLLNEIGEAKADKYKVKFLPSDFKKKEGYKRSIELSKEYNLYRQNYCGCSFSKETCL